MAAPAGASWAWLDSAGSARKPSTEQERQAMKNFLLSLAVSVVFHGAAWAEDLRAEIDGTLVKFVAALNGGDAEAVAGFYTPDAALLPPGGERVDGRSAIREFWQKTIDSGLRAEKLHAVEVIPGGDIAGEVGVFTLTVPGEDGLNRTHGKYIVIWKRDGGVWRLHRDIWNAN